ncbi:MAG: hypothetical protein EZS28_051614 [Streblomastix strix]|uniref:Uncharacterized protein n=1 Tax=Streblomastix strix TaxID=222440 RepID=A0A5J4T2Y0_9EUKA|nr:MAG: hypothetical protein EZS28_051614 [Streblomastix strix]
MEHYAQDANVEAAVSAYNNNVRIAGLMFAKDVQQLVLYAANVNKQVARVNQLNVGNATNGSVINVGYNVLHANKLCVKIIRTRGKFAVNAIRQHAKSV